MKYLTLEDSSEDQFKRYVIISFAIHVVALLFFGLKATLFPHEAINLDSAIRVDMVALPDKVASLPPPTPVEMKKPVPEPKPKAKPQQPKVNVLAKIKKMQQEENEKKVLDKIKQEVERDQEKEARQEKLNKLLKGNAISPGTALHGLTKTEFNEYIGSIHEHVRQHWNLPEWLQNDTLKATIVVYIDFRGVVTKRVLEKSSGDSRFDGFALKAVDEASPFPQPPSKFVSLVKEDGITLGFPQ